MIYSCAKGLKCLGYELAFYLDFKFANWLSSGGRLQLAPHPCKMAGTGLRLPLGHGLRLLTHKAHMRLLPVCRTNKNYNLILAYTTTAFPHTVSVIQAWRICDSDWQQLTAKCNVRGQIHVEARVWNNLIFYFLQNKYFVEWSDYQFSRTRGGK